MELFIARGFDHTAVAEIAQRAGLTERTFFRHFADKREVLFSGGELLVDLLARTVASAPDAATAIDAAAAGLDAIGTRLQQRRDFACKRSKIIAATPELQERELIKLASMAAALADVLRERGIAESTASLVAEVAIAVFKTAFERWVDESNQYALPELICQFLDELRALTGLDRQAVAMRAQP